MIRRRHPRPEEDHFMATRLSDPFGGCEVVIMPAKSLRWND
jgi:hypothetical protein